LISEFENTQCDEDSSLGLFDSDEPVKRTLTERERQILYERAGHKCENPAHAKKIEYSEMQVGHKKAYSKGGSTTLKNSVALCYRCNKLQGTDNWEVFLGKQGVTVPVDRLRGILNKLSLSELKYLAAKHGIKLKGRSVEGDLFSDDRYMAPSKTRFVKELAKVVSENEIRSALSEKLNSRLQ